MADKEEVGALWKRTSKAGKVYYTGKIAGVDVVGFINKSDNPKAPVVKFYKSEPRGESEA